MEPHSPAYVILFSGGIMVLIILTLLGNVLVCLAVYHCQSLRRRVNYLILSLAVSDIVTAMIAMPIWMHFEITSFRNMSHDASARLDTAYKFIDHFTGVASIANLTAISYERLWSVYSPLKHRRYFTSFTVSLLIFGAWLYALIAASVSFSWRYHEGRAIITCTVGFFIPLFLIVVAYIFISFIAKRSPRSIISVEDNTRINRSICVVIGLFVLCWAPYIAVSILADTCCYFYVLENLWLRSLSKWLHYANSCVNPVVYGIANPQYKEAFREVFKKICSQCVLRYKGETQGEPPILNSFQPRAHQLIHNEEKALFVDLTPEEKLDCSPDNLEMEETSDVYPPGDYRALPNFTTPRMNRRDIDDSENLGATPRMNGKDLDTSENSLKTPTMNRRGHVQANQTPQPSNRDTEIGSIHSESSVLDDSFALQQALLNPELLRRTSYL